jgi:L-ascorbate metabolism protein UlaG (beta-lactamase superfamily)
MRIIDLGHSAFLLGAKGEVLIDPYLTGNWLAAASAEDMEPNLILMIHAHHDHIGTRSISPAERALRC